MANSRELARAAASLPLRITHLLDGVAVPDGLGVGSAVAVVEKDTRGDLVT